MEAGSWPGVACDIKEVWYKYLFGGMLPQPQTRDMVEGSRKSAAEQDLEMMVSKIQK